MFDFLYGLNLPPIDRDMYDLVGLIDSFHKAANLTTNLSIALSLSSCRVSKGRTHTPSRDRMEVLSDSMLDSIVVQNIQKTERFGVNQ